MKNKISQILIFIAFFATAQNKFENGYYVDNAGKKSNVKF